MRPGSGRTKTGSFLDSLNQLLDLRSTSPRNRSARFRAQNGRRESDILDRCQIRLDTAAVHAGLKPIERTQNTHHVALSRVETEAIVFDGSDPCPLRIVMRCQSVSHRQDNGKVLVVLGMKLWTSNYTGDFFIRPQSAGQKNLDDNSGREV